MDRDAYTRAHFDFDELPFLTSPRQKLGLEAVGLGLIRLPAGRGYTFMHRHEVQEEVYVVLDGAGVLRVEDEDLPLERGDVVRVSPSAKRALRAADDSELFVLCAGAAPAPGFPRNPSARYVVDDGMPDYEDVPPWYADDAEVRAKNAELRARMERARARDRSS